MANPRTFDWYPRLCALGFAAAAVTSAVFWALRISPPTELLPPISQESAISGAMDVAGVTRALGGAMSLAVAAPTVTEASRFTLIGVLAHPNSSGAALIAVDGQAPKTFSVGRNIVDGLVLMSVLPRRVLIGRLSQKGSPASESIALDLPVLEKK